MRRLLIIFLISALSGGFFQSVQAASMVDTDQDGLPDEWETQIFATDPQEKDSDHDTFIDLLEVRNGYNPGGPGKKEAKDFDADGLNDRLEMLFGTDPTLRDTDLDGRTDGEEVAKGFSPTSTSGVPLPKLIEIKLSTQRLQQKLGGIVLAEYPVSTGKKSTPTPPGVYKTQNKIPRAWSKHAKLWMPWWMQFSSKGFGLHELPEWPSGKKEGEKSLGQMASGGCVRLGVGAAKALYDWTPVGTTVKVIK